VIATAKSAAPEHWLLGGLELEETASLSNSGWELRFEPGEMIFREGDAADGVYLLTAGTVLISSATEGEPTVLSLVHANEVFGEMGVLDGQQRSATATATGICAAYFIPSEPFLDVLERSHMLRLRTLALLTKRLRIANGRLGELAATTALAPDTDEFIAA